MMAQPIVHERTVNRTDAEVLYCDSDVALGAAGDVFFILWRDRTTVEGVSHLRRTFDEHTRSFGRELALVTIIEAKAKMPSPGSREPLAEWLRDAGSKILISGIAFEGNGFLAAGVRGVVVGLTMLARQPYPHRVFKSVELATQWMEAGEPRVGKHFDAKVLQRSVSKFRMLVARR